MIPAHIMHRIKELELHTRRILSSSGIGATRSRQKGFGLEFDQLRSYQYGDDVRLIDWKSSARSDGSLFVRQYFEERSRNFIICLDVSSSTLFGSGISSKQEIMQQIAGILALSAAWSKDKISLILFSDHIESVVFSGTGRNHVHYILEKIFTHNPVGRKTDMNVLCDYVQKHMPSKSTMLVVSDFIVQDFSYSLKKIISRKNFVAITYLDHQEIQLQNVGLVWMQDPESDQIVLVNTAHRNNIVISEHFNNRIRDQKILFQNHGVEVVLLKNQATFMHDLIFFFKKRMIY